MLKIKNLSKSYHLTKANVVDAIKDISFEIQDKEVAAIVGPSGSGKSTLLNVLGGLDLDYKGHIYLDDRELRNFNANFYRRYVVGTIFQQFYLIPSLTVVENIALPATFSNKYPKDELNNRIEHLLKEVGLTDRRTHRPKELSGGQAQRVAIARALMADPAIVLADEPTGNLDSKTGAEIIDLLYKINEDEGTTIVVVTHDMDVIDSIKRKIFLKDGVIEKETK